MVKVVNKTTKYDVYCGRGTPFGNPFYLNKDESKRDEVCDLYEEHFYNSLEFNKEFKEAVNHLVTRARNGDLILGCHCKPKRCHVETIANYINGLLLKELSESF